MMHSFSLPPLFCVMLQLNDRVFFFFWWGGQNSTVEVEEVEVEVEVVVVVPYPILNLPRDNYHFFKKAHR